MYEGKFQDIGCFDAGLCIVTTSILFYQCGKRLSYIKWRHEKITAQVNFKKVQLPVLWFDYCSAGPAMV